MEHFRQMHIRILPKHTGAKQPGMTGQVKEDIINRWAELGVQAHQEDSLTNRHS